jgi:hypothetical protein
MLRIPNTDPDPHSCQPIECGSMGIRIRIQITDYIFDDFSLQAKLQKGGN